MRGARLPARLIFQRALAIRNPPLHGRASAQRASSHKASDKRLRKIMISPLCNWLLSCKAQTRRSARRQVVRATSSVAALRFAPGVAQPWPAAFCASISYTMRSSCAVISAGDEGEAVLGVTRQIIGLGGQFAHQRDQRLLHLQKPVADKRMPGRGARQTEGGV